VTSAAAALDVGSVARLFKALGEETRVRIVALLAHGELCVCHLEAALDLPQPTISRQLAVLRSAGVVGQRRQGIWVYYRLAKQRDEECKRQMRGLIAAFTPRKELRRDVKRLLRAKGPLRSDTRRHLSTRR
jgi:ArsR family transcriptional regulator